LSVPTGRTLRFSQITGKYRTLRAYWDGRPSSEADAQVEEAMALAEAPGTVTCEVCCEEGRLRGALGVTADRRAPVGP